MPKTKNNQGNSSTHADETKNQLAAGYKLTPDYFISGPFREFIHHVTAICSADPSDKLPADVQAVIQHLHYFSKYEVANYEQEMSILQRFVLGNEEFHMQDFDVKREFIEFMEELRTLLKNLDHLAHFRKVCEKYSRLPMA